MRFQLQAACGCNLGKVRTNNEDNLLFFGKSMPKINLGFRKPRSEECVLEHPLCFAVFDGMGGEDYGEVASYAATQALKDYLSNASDYIIPEKHLLAEACQSMNAAVFARACEYKTERMGTTALLAYFTSEDLYICNLGDSRAFRLRSGEFLQLSQDHTNREELTARGITGQKPRLTQFLGLDPQKYILEPFIAKGKLCIGDQYLLCSDGLTDMLSNIEIACILRQADSAQDAVRELVSAALACGGKDNITAIVCRIAEENAGS